MSSAVKGRVIQIISNQLKVLLENNEIVEAIIMGKVRLDKPPVVGDYVLVESLDDKMAVQEILPRENELKRPVLANVDQVLIVMSTKTPDFSSLLCDRMIFKVQLAHIHPVIVFTKMDKVDKDDEVYRYIEDYRQSGYEVVLVDKENDLTPLRELLKNKISVLSGNSGVGKSTLLNRLDDSLQIKTQEVSLALNRGKHTTTHTTLHPLEGGYLADTPGFSTINFDEVTPQELSEVIRDFDPYRQCKFRDCLHQSEPKCGIKKAVEKGLISSIRYENYLKVIPECKGEKR